MRESKYSERLTNSIRTIYNGTKIIFNLQNYHGGGMLIDPLKTNRICVT